MLKLMPATTKPDASWGKLRVEIRRFVARRVAPSDVDDVVQEVLTAIANTEASRPANVGAFATVVARRTVAAHHRRRAREHRRMAQLALEADLDIADSGQPILQSAMAQAVWYLLEEITPVYAEALRAVDAQGATQQEVARTLGIPASTLRTRVQRGRAELRAVVKRYCEIELDGRGAVLACELRPTARR